MDSLTTTYHDVYMGWFQGQTVVFPGVKRLSNARMELMARRLWTAAGMDPDRLDQVSAEELRRFARTRAGRYPYLKVTVYDDDTYSYETPTSGGGNFDLAEIIVLDPTKYGEILPIPSPLD